MIDDNEPAVQRLVAHFHKVMDNIVIGEHLELPDTAVIVRELLKQKKKTYFFKMEDCKNLWTKRDSKQTMWLSRDNLSVLLRELRAKVMSYLLILLFVDYT